MNLGDGLLFELENGKPKVILLNRGQKDEKNSVNKLRPRLPSVLSCRQTPRLDTPQALERPIRKQNVLNGRNQLIKPGRGRGQTVTTLKTQENTASGRGAKTTAPVKLEKNPTMAPNRKPEELIKKKGTKSELPNPVVLDSVACLTNQHLQQILGSVQTNILEPSTEECTPESTANETKGREETKEETMNAPDKDKRSGGLFSWMEERSSEDRATMEAKKIQWKKELDEQVALKQKQAPALARLQVEEHADSFPSVHSSIRYKELPAAIRSSLKIGEFTPMEQAGLTVEEVEKRRLWLVELDKQREETSERKRLEKLLHRQTEDQQHWASHFDSLQRQPMALGPDSDRGASSCGQDSVKASVESNSSRGNTNRTSHIRTMTSLLDPAQIEERARRRLKILEYQKVIELQMEDHRRRKEEEEARRRRDEEEEERRVELEREQLQRQYEKDTDRHKEQHETEQLISTSTEPPPQSTATNQEQCLKQEAGPTAVNPLRHTAVQTEEVLASEGKLLNSETRGQESHSESSSVPGQVGHLGQRGLNGDVYEAFSRTEKRPQWNKHRPIRRFVPASQRYPEELQKYRQQNRLKRQAQLLAQQKKQATSNHTGQETQRGTSGVETDGQTERGQCPVHSESPAPDFLPYVRTAEVFNLIPEETFSTHSPHTAPAPAAAPQILEKTQRQQEILRGLAKLRQGLLQKQRELELDLSRLDDDPQPLTMAMTHRHEL